MGKTKVKHSTKLALYVQQFPVLKTDGQVLYCKLCNKPVSADKLFNVKQHMQGTVHKALQAKSTKDGLEQQFISENTTASKNEQFARDMCTAFVAADIPLSKIRNNSLKSFFEKYVEYVTPSETTLRRNVDWLYMLTIENIKAEVKNHFLWVSVDETTDSEGRYIGNVIIGILSSELVSTKRMLLNTAILEKADHAAIAQLFDASIKLLGADFNKNNILLLITDAAPYMTKAAKVISVFYPKITHVTCLAHALHRICEKIRDLYPKVDQLIANVKKIFLKAPLRLTIFKEMEPDIPVPPQPIVTRWGTWLEAVHYYAEHFEQINRIVSALNCEEAQSIKIVQNLLSDDSVRKQIIFIESNFNFLVSSIKKLETTGLLLCDQIEIVIRAKELIDRVDLPPVHDKFKYVLEKNKGFAVLKDVAKNLSSDREVLSNLSKMYSIKEILSFKYATITSVDVERSFSIYKSLYRDNRHSFTFENLKKHIFIYCNNNLK